MYLFWGWSPGIWNLEAFRNTWGGLPADDQAVPPPLTPVESILSISCSQKRRPSMTRTFAPSGTTKDFNRNQRNQQCQPKATIKDLEYITTSSIYMYSIYIYIYIYKYIYTHKLYKKYVNECIYVCMYACMHACMHVCVRVYIYVHTGVARNRGLSRSPPLLQTFVASLCVEYCSLQQACGRKGLSQDPRFCYKPCRKNAAQACYKPEVFGPLPHLSYA